MSLEFELDTIEGVDETISKFYTQDEESGKYYLKVNGAVAKSKLKEFRDKNIELMKERDTILSKYHNLDPDELLDLKKRYKDTNVEELKKQLDEALKGKITQEEIEATINKRVDLLKGDYESKLQSLTTDRDTLSTQLQSTLANYEKLVIDSEIKGAAVQAGVLPSALDDVMLRARSSFKVENGRIVPYDTDGTIMYGKDGKSPMAAGDWVGYLKKNAPHLFTQSQGSGATPRTAPPTPAPANLTSVQKIMMGLEGKS